MSFKKIEEVAGEATERKNPVPPQPADTTQQPSVFYDPKTDSTEKKPGTTNTSQPVPETPGKLSKDEAKQSGEANAYLHAGIQENLLKGIILWRYITRFSDDEKEKVISLGSKPDTDHTPEEKNLNARFLKYSETFTKQNEKAKMDKDELDNLAYGYSLHAEITGTKTNPNVIIASTIINGFINKAMDVLTS